MKMLIHELQEIEDNIENLHKKSREIYEGLCDIITSIDAEDAKKLSGLFIELCDAVHDWEEFDIRFEYIKDTLKEDEKIRRS